jgi:homoserine kinase
MIKIKVPATSANMGPGFDCLGVALDLYNEFEVEETSEGIEITGCAKEYCNSNNLFYRSMNKCFEAVGYSPKGLRIKVASAIPISRGLGSSAACIVGGIAAANELAGSNLSLEHQLEIANAIEGHPDNVAPALLGGMTIAVQDNGKVFYDKVSLSEDIGFCALVPDFTLSTKEARAVLPKQLTYKDAIYNISRATLLVTALANGNYKLIQKACEDSLHQPYRSKLIPGYESIFSKAKELGCLGVFLSGAGPTIMTMLEKNNRTFIPEMEKYLKTLNSNWIVKKLNVDNQGTIITRTSK